MITVNFNKENGSRHFEMTDTFLDKIFELNKFNLQQNGVETESSIIFYPIICFHQLFADKSLLFYYRFTL